MSKKKSQETEQYKMEAASEIGVDLKKNQNSDNASNQTGSVGGRMVKKMVEDMERKMDNNS